MDKARAAVASFTNKRGHATDVTESVAPAVTSEYVKPTRHEEITEAVNREVHQDHHHTTIQPIQHQEVLPEQHHHVMKDTIKKEFHHDNHDETRLKLEREAAQFKNTTHTHETRHTTAAAPRVEGEHVHHHVHETVQPIVHKETIAPEVVHTVIPIHEEHHAAAQHHGVSILPTKTLDSFTSAGGILKGGSTSAHERYDGAPRPYNKELMHNPTDSDHNLGTTGLGGNHHHNTDGTGVLGSSTGSTNAGPHNSNLANKFDPSVDSDRDGRKGIDSSSQGNHSHNNGYDNNNTEHGQKPGMLEKIKRVI